MSHAHHRVHSQHHPVHRPSSHDTNKNVVAASTIAAAVISPPPSRVTFAASPPNHHPHPHHPPLHHPHPSSHPLHSPLMKRSVSSTSITHHSLLHANLVIGDGNESVNMMHAQQDDELYELLQEQSGNSTLTIRALQTALLRSGMHPADPRLREVHRRLNSNPTDELSFEQFKHIIECASLLIYRALTRKLVIPDWYSFISTLDELFHEVSSNTKGKVASYIPELANASPETFGMSFCSVDGQQHGCGDIHFPFSVQSTSKPISYLIALEELGAEYVHNFVGTEPSGRHFNEMCLNSNDIPHNPLINAGAIMVTSLIHHGSSQPDRFGRILQYWKRLTGNSRELAFSNTVYLSEKSTANRNMCLGYMMQERKAFQYGAHGQDIRKQQQQQQQCSHANHSASHEPPISPQPASSTSTSSVASPSSASPSSSSSSAFKPRVWKDTDLQANLDLYFSLCSLEATTTSMSIVAATLANGGVCPLTSDRIFQPEYVKNCLALMLSCGMYDYSGEWGFVVGLPAKSGVSGIIMVVIPNIGGLALLSPRLDELGNSVRGIEFAQRLAKKFELHFLNFHRRRNGGGGDTTEMEQKKASEVLTNGNMSNGDAPAPSTSVPPTTTAAAAAPPCTPLHHLPLVRRTPRLPYHDDLSISFIFACATGDLGLVRSLMASAVDMNATDYDGRTALHLASCNGHVEIVQVLLRKGVDINPVDRLGGTPLADAIREGRLDVVNLLRRYDARLSGEETEEQEEELEE